METPLRDYVTFYIENNYYNRNEYIYKLCVEYHNGDRTTPNTNKLYSFFKIG